MSHLGFAVLQLSTAADMSSCSVSLMFGWARIAGWCPVIANRASLGMGMREAANVALVRYESDLRATFLTAVLNFHSSLLRVGGLPILVR